jgi:hypothetical protein
MKLKSTFFIITLLSLSANTVHSQKTLLESFNYAVGTSLELKGTSTDGWGGAWTKTAGTAQIIEGNFGSDTGKKLKTWYATDDTGDWVKYTRNLAERWKDDGKAIWVSFYMSCTHGDTPRYAQLALIDLNDGGPVISPPFIIGVSGSTSGKIGINATALSSVSDNQLNYILAKIECDGVEDRYNLGDKVYFWVNYFGQTEPATSTAVASLAISLAGWDQLRISSHKEYTTEWDKIRISNTFAPEVLSGISTPVTNAFDIQFLPNSNQLKLSVDAENVSVLNLQGKELIRSKGNSVDVANLNKGLYIVKAIYQGEATVKKLIKE